MANCKDCIHYNVCDDDIIDFFTDKNKVCRQFKTADIVEVVRCKNCKYGRYDLLDKDISCEKHCLYIQPNDFCSYGTPKNDEVR